MHCRTCGKDVLEQAVVCVSCGVQPLAGDRYCQHCGAETNPAAVVCVKCGVPLKTAGLLARIGGRARPGGGAAGEGIVASDPPMDPILMAALSGCLIAWLGQIVLGQKTKGFVMVGISILLALLTVGLSILIVWPLAAVDAYLIGKKLKEGKTVGEWEFF